MARKWATVWVGMCLATVCSHAADQDEQPHSAPRSAESWADLIREVLKTPDEAQSSDEEEQDPTSADETSGNAEATRPNHEAAEQGDADAQYNLGLIYSTGEGVPQDHVEAQYWLRLAAEQNHTKAQALLDRLGTAQRGSTSTRGDEPAAEEVSAQIGVAWIWWTAEIAW